MIAGGARRALIVGTLILAAIWGGVSAYRIWHASRSSVAMAGAAVAPAGSAVAVPAGTASSASPIDSLAETPALKIPEHLPRFSLNDLSGHLQSSAAWSGKPLVINFWATWCAPCRREIPLLKSLSAEWAPREVSVIGIAVDYPDKVKKMVDELQIGYPVLVGDEDALDLAAELGFTAPAFPFTVFVDREAEVVTLFVGELHRPQANLILAVVQDLDRKAIGLPQAREEIAAGLGRIAAAASVF